uniref:Aspartate dehydrogenase domain-containing protein n=1 Tax=Meleagris gallopavo TaxID=9103 RepID=A0A803XW91_MELGA
MVQKLGSQGTLGLRCCGHHGWDIGDIGVRMLGPSWLGHWGYWGHWGQDVGDIMLGSPTALADPQTEQRLRGAALRGGHTLYVPRGALWGCEDIRRMDENGTLAALKVTMTKAPQSFRLQGWLQERLVAAVTSGGRVVLYEGPLRPLCPLAPNNVNTMAAAAVAAPSLGFDGVQACLVADPSVPDWHVVEVEVTGTGDNGRALRVTSSRRNPAATGAVTGDATKAAFWSSPFPPNPPYPQYVPMTPNPHIPNMSP